MQGIISCLFQLRLIFKHPLHDELQWLVVQGLGLEGGWWCLAEGPLDVTSRPLLIPHLMLEPPLRLEKTLNL